ncbi:MAG: cytochrome c biogenesis protein ResB [Rikenellaceae bacterium]
MWQIPWGYPESFVVVEGLILIGLLLQICVGSFDFYLLAQPVNYVVCGVVAVLSIFISRRVKHGSFARWMVGVPFSVAIISGLLLLSIVMGVTPQSHHSHTLLGFDSMTSNWAFVMIYTLAVVVLGGVILRRADRFKLADLPFYFNHLGLFILLLGSGVGYADMERYVMYVNEGETQWRVYDNQNQVKELPIAITLNDFDVEFYPSKALYFDAETGEIQKGNPSKYENHERYKKVMSEPEPKRFSSQVEVFTQQGHSIEATIEVNKPLRIDSWTIYQYGYDNRAGAQSSYSSFELVYDRWLTMVYVGIIMMMMGGVAMALRGSNIKRR